VERIDVNVGHTDLVFEMGRMARQAHGSVTVQYGGTMILATAVASSKPREGLNFFPLTVDYREKQYAAGKIPGNFFRREGRPSEKEILTCRLIDRPIRPLFPKGYKNEVQVMITVLSADDENDPDILALNGATAALLISDLPFTTPLAAVRVGRVDGRFVANPTLTDLETSDLDLVIAGSADSIVMVEGGGREVGEDVVLDALEFGHRELQPVVETIKTLAERCGKVKVEVEPPAEPECAGDVRTMAEARLRDSVLRIADKREREDAAAELLDRIQSELAERYPEMETEIEEVFHQCEAEVMRRMILDEKRRVDGRALDEIRPISCEVGILPQTHGSALFTRGETQAIVAITLGTSRDEQRLDELQSESFKTFKNFMLHYNFPPFSVGEVRPIRGPGRREIGHGALAERALRPIIPDKETFPYTTRIVSDILESNGSSSMATVCGGSLALMDGGVPVPSAMAGIAMGLVKEDDRVAVLSDILGIEDHLGDMDFKVAGTAKGITALQMDIKIGGVTYDILRQALAQAHEGRKHILARMNDALSVPRSELSPYAPRIVQITIPVDKIRDLIGPGGRVIRGICAKTEAEIDVDDDGKVSISASDDKSLGEALRMVQDVVAEPEIGKIYDGVVQRITDFGAFVEILPGKDGLVRIGQLADYHVNRVEDILKEGDTVKVKCIEIDSMNRINLSKVQADRELGLIPPRKDRDRRPPRHDDKPRHRSKSRPRGGKKRY